VTEPVTIVESRPALIALDHEQAEALRAVGRELAGKTEWWGRNKREEPPKPRSVLVEEGLRNVLKESIGGGRVKEGGIYPKGSMLRFDPDLVFDNERAVGDVKYRLSKEGWSRPELYQIIAFAEAYQAQHGAVLGFRKRNRSPLPELLVGRKRIRELAWIAEKDLAPEAAAAQLAAETRDWLDQVVSVQPAT
jgi:hypothetical protein